MQKFYFADQMVCRITFWKEVEAENEREAWEAFQNDEYRYLGFETGDTHDDSGNVEVCDHLPDVVLYDQPDEDRAALNMVCDHLPDVVLCDQPAEDRAALNIWTLLSALVGLSIYISLVGVAAHLLGG